MILQGGERLYVGLAKHGHRSSAGTSVIVRDLFYKWPVRRKQAESSTSFAAATLNQIRRHLEALAIINHSVAFQVYDLGRPDSNAIPGRILTTTASSSMSDCIASLHGKHLVKVRPAACRSPTRVFSDTLFE
jgi:DNA mismatch repair protein MLH3